MALWGPGGEHMTPLPSPFPPLQNFFFFFHKTATLRDSQNLSSGWPLSDEIRASAAGWVTCHIELQTFTWSI